MISTLALIINILTLTFIAIVGYYVVIVGEREEIEARKQKRKRRRTTKAKPVH